MKNYRQSSIPVILVLAFLTYSFLCCSVKEDRDFCPSVLNIELPEIQDEKLMVAVMDMDSVLFYDSYDGDELETLSYNISVKVPKTALNVSAYWPELHTFNPLNGYLPDGKCAPIWSSHISFTPQKEIENVRLPLSKNYCRLSLTIAGDFEDSKPYSLLFRSSVMGYDRTGALIAGQYFERADMTAEGIYEINILRQNDDSLMMDLISSADEEIFRSFAIGRYLADFGYDWNASNLEDVKITLDFARVQITLECSGWSKVIELDVVI